MKGLLVLVVAALVLTPGVGIANPIPCGGFAPYSDTAGTNCFIDDHVAGLLTVYIVDTSPSPTGFVAVQFSSPLPACLIGAIYLSDTAVFPVTIGNSQTGVAVGYGQCLNNPVHVLTINVFAAGQSSDCCFWFVRPDPALPSGEIEAVDCNNNLLLRGMLGGNGIVNPDASHCTSPTQPATWGLVKQMYRGS